MGVVEKVGKRTVYTVEGNSDHNQVNQPDIREYEMFLYGMLQCEKPAAQKAADTYLIKSVF